MTRFKHQERSPDSRRISGIQIRLNYLCKYQWSRLWERPSVMAVRTEQDVVDYCKKILEIRAAAEKDGFREYLETEKQLLRLCYGTLPAAIKLRARWPYLNSPRVRLWESQYAGPAHAKSVPLILREFQETTGYGPAAFEEQLDADERAIWESMKPRELVLP